MPSREQKEAMRQPFGKMTDLAHCIRDELDLEAKCLACGHTTILDPHVIRAITIKKRIWTALKDIEKALRCTKCQGRTCKLTPVDRF